MKPSIEYLTGWFDGEGCIRVNKLHGGKHHVLTVSVNQTYFPILHEVMSLYGGTVGEYWHPKDRKPVTNWNCGNRMAEKFLQDIYPYLHEKKEQAWLGLEFREQCFNHKTSGPITEEDYALREGFALALSLAKR